jgi:hypothetical protein
MHRAISVIKVHDTCTTYLGRNPISYTATAGSQIRKGRSTEVLQEIGIDVRVIATPLL